MTTSNQKLFDMAELAEASYVLFERLDASHSVLDLLKDSDSEGKFTSKQADDFVAHWIVKSHQANTPDSGYSATLFKSVDTGAYV